MNMQRAHENVLSCKTPHNPDTFPISSSIQIHSRLCIKIHWHERAHIPHIIPCSELPAIPKQKTLVIQPPALCSLDRNTQIIATEAAASYKTA